MSVGRKSRAAALSLRRWEAPGINTLYQDHPSVVWSTALGSFVTDLDGRRLLDFTSGFGVAALGHRPPAVVAAVTRQLDLLVHGLGDVAAHPTRIALARRLCRLAPMQPAQVYWATSGSDAVEIAIKTARLASERPTVVAFDLGYHGLSAGALAATGRPAFRTPFAAHLDPHVVHLPWGAPLAELQRVLTSTPVAAVLVEPVAGREGIMVPPPGWLPDLAASARAAGALVIADEILTGGGRTGTFWASSHEGLTPDLLCFGKAIGGGLPLSGVLGRQDLMAAWPATGEALHTGTFIAHPLACAASLAALPLLRSARLAARVARGETMIADAFALREDLAPTLQCARGRGLMWALVLESADLAAKAASLALERGVLILAGGRYGTTLQILPPLVISPLDLRRGLGVLERVLRDLQRKR